MSLVDQLERELDRTEEIANKFDIKATAKADDHGPELLDEIRAFVARFCVFPDEHCLTAVTLWAAHAHMVEHFYTTPRLALLSPEAGSGKTRVLEILDLLTPNSKLYFSPSPSTIFRILAATQITLLLDECDTIFSFRGKDDGNEELRALLNTGYKRGATIPRCVGPKHEVQEFHVFAAVALAGLGDLPDTIMSRSIIIRMRRRAPAEKIEPFRSREHEPQGHVVRDRLVAWAESVGPAVGEAWPTMPVGIVDRPAEVWEPLLAVADAAGGSWPEKAREACIALCRVADNRTVSLGIRLLADLRTIFGDADALHTKTILQRLCAGEENRLAADAPWGDLRGKPLGSRGLATMLKRYQISSKKVWADGKSLQGYSREQLWDVWSRYLPPLGSAEAEGMEGVEGAAPSLGLRGNEPSGDLPNLPDGKSNGNESGSSTGRENTAIHPDLLDLPDMRDTERDRPTVTERF